MEKHWCTVIGKLQTQVPAHVAQEYCRPNRSFEPTPSFREPTLIRTFKLYDDEGVWYPLGKMKYGFLGFDFAVLTAGAGPRAGRGAGRGEGMFLSLFLFTRGWAWVSPGRDFDYSALAELCKVRTAHYEELKAKLR